MTPPWSWKSCRLASTHWSRWLYKVGLPLDFSLYLDWFLERSWEAKNSLGKKSPDFLGRHWWLMRFVHMFRFWTLCIMVKIKIGLILFLGIMLAEALIKMLYEIGWTYLVEMRSDIAGRQLSMCLSHFCTSCESNTDSCLFWTIFLRIFVWLISLEYRKSFALWNKNKNKRQNCFQYKKGNAPSGEKIRQAHCLF